MDITKELSKIDSYLFKYTPEAQSLYPNGEHSIDDKEHIGVMAQELQSNPVTQATVEENEDGYLMVNTSQLTLTLTAVCSELSKKVDNLEKIVSDLSLKLSEV